MGTNILEGLIEQFLIDNNYRNMLKLNSNVTPSWAINWNNKVFVLPNYIGYIQSIYLDGTDIGSEYSFSWDTITLSSSPSATISVTYFSREERDVMWNWELTMWDLIDWVYSELGRKNVSRIYPKDRIRQELNDTIWLLLDDVPERSNIQHYSFKGLNWLTIINEENSLVTADVYNVDIEWSMLVGEGVFYNYYGYDWSRFDVIWDISDNFDKIIVGHRIPSWVERVSEIYVDSEKLEYIDSRDFYMDTQDKYTIIRDQEGSSYLFLPFCDKEYTCVVKYLPDYADVNLDNDIINIEKRCKRLPIYDVVYRLLASREDDRAWYYKKEKEELYLKYRAFKANATRKTKSKIWIATTYRRERREADNFLPQWVYDNVR